MVLAGVGTALQSNAGPARGPQARAPGDPPFFSVPHSPNFVFRGDCLEAPTAAGRGYEARGFSRLSKQPKITGCPVALVPTQQKAKKQGLSLSQSRPWQRGSRSSRLLEGTPRLRAQAAPDGAPPQALPSSILRCKGLAGSPGGRESSCGREGVASAGPAPGTGVG